jgi:hypothetical protein
LDAIVLALYIGGIRQAGRRGRIEVMALRTSFTEALSVDHPIALAPMGGCAGGALAAAVSNAGGLGLLGAARDAMSTTGSPVRWLWSPA